MAGDDSNATRTPLRGSQSEPITLFKKHNRDLLEPPYQDKFTEERKHGFIAHCKMRSYAQILTTPTADTPGTTLLLHFDSKRYLIGSLAEGTQRACIQMGARLLRVSECFLTGRTEWRNTGGLIGIVLTLADSSASSQTSSLEDAVAKAEAKGRRMGFEAESKDMEDVVMEAMREVREKNGGGEGRLTVFGPRNLNYMLATARRFVFRKGLPLDLHEIAENEGLGVKEGEEDEEEWAPYWADENVKVWAMSISPSSPSSTSASPTNDTETMTMNRSRKRSIHEVYNGKMPPPPHPIANRAAPPFSTSPRDLADNLTSQQRDLLTNKAVVSEMFNSSWRLDTLHPTPLSRVNLPATIFFRNPANHNKIERYTGPLPGGDAPVPDPNMEVLVRKPWPGALVEKLPQTEPAREAVSYVIKNHVQRGKFQPHLARQKNVEQGRLWSLLAAGESVKNDDGEIVTPHEVLGESKEGGGLAVVDLPDASYIDALVARREWREPKVMSGVGAIVWICGRGVAMDGRVQAFMREFAHVEHVVSSPGLCADGIALDSVAAATVRLSKIDPGRWRVPVHDEAVEHQQSLPGGVHVAERGQVVQLEPSMEFKTDQVVPPLDVAAVVNELSPSVLDEAVKAQEAASNDEAALAWTRTLPDQARDAEIITLGTGSALPSKYRNVSATLLRVPGWGNVLFDCGENTLGQLGRVFEADELRHVLRDLRMIFISHMHADHHLGTVGVVRAWYEEVHGAKPVDHFTESSVQDLIGERQRLAIISEPAMLAWLTEYASVEDYGLSRLALLHVSAQSKKTKFTPSTLAWFTPPSKLAALDPQARIEHRERRTVKPSWLGLDDVQAVAVTHCHGARAVSITWPSGFKVSYSGDCRPSKSFSDIGKGSTVCIHEATFDDELVGDARAKNHSTTSEALGVAQAMGARGCVLTHFSQRYQKVPVVDRLVEGGDGEDVAMAGNPDGEEAADVEEEPTNPEAEDASDNGGPLEAVDVATTFPDQPTSNGGRQYDLPSSKRSTDPFADRRKSGLPSSSGPGPATVKLRLASDMKVCVAFDYMRVKVGGMAQVEAFTPALLGLFADEARKEEEKKEVVRREAERMERGKREGVERKREEAKRSKAEKKREKK